MLFALDNLTKSHMAGCCLLPTVLSADSTTPLGAKCFSTSCRLGSSCTMLQPCDMLAQLDWE